MKKLIISIASIAAFVAGPVLAADLPPRQPPPPPYKAPPPVVQQFSWTGCYIGVNGGGLWGQNRSTAFDGVAFNNSSKWGGFGGGQVGCDIQTGQFVFGAEVQGDWTSLSLSAPQTAIPANAFQMNARAFGTGTGRIGYAFDRSLLYVKGGFAWMDFRYSALAGGVVLGGPNSHTATGWTAGVGYEYAFTRNVSAKIEYNYLGLTDSRNIFCPTCVLQPTPFSTKYSVSEVLVGLNLRWGPGGY